MCVSSAVIKPALGNIIRRGGVMDVRISLYGCDDETNIDTDVTAEEYDFLRKLERLSKENSDYACQPTLDVKIKGNTKSLLGQADSLKDK